MADKAKFLETIQHHQDLLRSFGVKRIGLFGSVLRGEQTSDSDVDVLVQFDKGKKNYRNFIGIVDLLEKELESNVELVTEESLSPYIGPRILAEVEYAAFQP